MLPPQVYVDTVGDADKHRERLEQRFSGLGISFTVCPKADSIYPIVSAASIVAKASADLSVCHAWLSFHRRVHSVRVRRQWTMPQRDACR